MYFENRQFDFIVWLNNIILIIEVDGDYWHRSKIKFPNIEDRKIIRLKDQLKESIFDKKIDKNNRKYYVIRFWENDLYKNIKYIKNELKNLIIFDKEKNEYGIKNTISKIKKNYQKKA